MSCVVLELCCFLRWFFGVCVVFGVFEVLCFGGLLLRLVFGV